MKRMSACCRRVRAATRSVPRARAGPEVMQILTPISWARTWARVVLPSPGGPWSRTCSRGSLRALTAAMAMERRLMRSAWPTYSEMAVGRRAQLTCSSCGAGLVERRRSVAMRRTRDWGRGIRGYGRGSFHGEVFGLPELDDLVEGAGFPD